jgi:hypothetical protein
VSSLERGAAHLVQGMGHGGPSLDTVARGAGARSTPGVAPREGR